MDPARYRAAADRCRKRSSSSADSREWIRFAQNWETLAEMAETLSANKLKRANSASLSPRNPRSCENPRKTLLLAGIFCARRDPSFRCDPVACNVLSPVFERSKIGCV
jgi:hypothetical protein